MYGKQMELFEQGGKVDKVSGNDIPLGSTAKEVRDDQPAMLSEGEMVIPADVVRYFGVEHFMTLRDQAKMGYKKMEAMGQFGTEKGQTLPDDTIFNAGGPPFTIEDIEVIEDYEENEKEEKEPIKAADGALVSTLGSYLPFLVSTAGTLNVLSGGSGSSGGSSTSSTTSAEDDLIAAGSGTAFPMSSAQQAMGVETFNYLNSFMPSSVVSTSTPTERSAVGNYIANLFKNIPATAEATGGDGATGGAVETTTATTTDAGGEGPVGSAGPSGGGASNTSLDTPGTGDIFTMMSYPSDANIQGLKGFGELKDTEFGKAFLSGMGMLVSAAMNPGQYAPVVGTVQGLAGMAEQALAGTSNISKGFQELKDIPIIQANMATRAARSFEYNLANLTPEQRSNLNSVALAAQFADAMGQSITDPNTTVAVTDRGQTVVSFSKGPLAAFYDPVTGDIIGDPRTKTLNDKEKEDAYNNMRGFSNDAGNAANPDFSPSDVDPGQAMFGGWGGPTSAEEAGGSRSYGDSTGFGNTDGADAGTSKSGVGDNSGINNTDGADPGVAPPSSTSSTISTITGPETNESLGGNVSPPDPGFSFNDDVGGQVSAPDPGFSFNDDVGGDGTGGTGGTGGTSTGGGMGSVAESATEAAATGLSGIDSFDTGDDGGGDGGDSGGGDGKIVCTMMNHLYGFSLKQNALWLRYAKTKQLDPAYQIGYHKIFTPLVRKMPTNKTIAFALSWLAKQRTNSIKKELKGSNVTLYKTIVRPTLGSVCFITGKLVQKGILKPAKLKTLQFNEKP